MSELYKRSVKLFKKYSAINDGVLAESSFVSADVDIIYHSKITRLDEDFILTELNNFQKSVYASCPFMVYIEMILLLI